MDDKIFLTYEETVKLRDHLTDVISLYDNLPDKDKDKAFVNKKHV